MNRIENYGVYQNNRYERTAQNKKENVKTNKADKTDKNSMAQLSSRAKKLLEELKKKYGNMDFMVADYENEEEASAYLSRGTKEYSVLIEPELLEEMAADEESKEKYLGKLDESTDQLAKMKDKLGDKKSEVVHMGVSIGKDGKLSYFAELEKMSAKQREHIEKTRERNREEKASAAKKESPDRGKRTRVTADSTGELLEKIYTVDWSKVQTEGEKGNGNRFECSI